MNTRFFLLLERQQKLDALLGLAQARRNVDPLEVVRLQARKRSVRERLARLMNRSVLRLA